MIVWVGTTCGNDNERGATASRGSRELQARRSVIARAISLLRMCLILAIVEVVSTSMTPRRSVYGDQGQEVAWEVSWEQFVAQQHKEESGPQQIPRAIGGRGGYVGDAFRVRLTLGIGTER
jgi:hypothetical protein